MRRVPASEGAWGAVVLLLLVGTTASANAAVLTVIPVSGSHDQYQAGSNGANGYSAATIAVTTVPTGTTVCTSGTKNIPLTGGTATLIFSSTGGTTCTAGDWSEEFTIAFSATIGTQTNTFTVTSAAGGGTPGVTHEAVKIGLIGIPLPTVATVYVYVDFGSASPPTGGVEILDLSIV
jgi:hypothetical protein